MILHRILSLLPSSCPVRRKARVTGAAGLVVASLSSYPVAHAQEDSAARAAIFSHPNVASLRAQICQFYAQADIARSGRYPQVDFRLGGGNSLASHIESLPQTERAIDPDNKDVDAIIGLRQNVYDWGVISNSVSIAETNRSIARIDVGIETDRQAADLLTLLIRYQELEEVEIRYRNLLDELYIIAARIEEGVNVGALTLTDLRTVKISIIDTEVEHLQVQRQIDILRADINERFQLTVEAGLPFLINYYNTRPTALPTLASADVKEVLKLDLQQRITDFELNRLRAQRRPALNAVVDTHLYDADSYSGEFEVVGRIEVTVPLYDGGSNKASQTEARWRSRSLVNERNSIIRNYDSQTEQIRQTLARLDRNIANNAESIIALDGQLEAFLAREGETVSDPLAKSNLLIQHNQQYLDQITLQSERDREFIRGLFFADALGSVLNLSGEVTTC
jgi:outer membrane protein TolC